MKRHPLRWDSLVFGLLFLAVVGNWAVWKQDVLSARQLSISGAAVLIVLGLVGVAATLRPSRPPAPYVPADPAPADREPVDPAPVDPEENHEAPDPQQ